MPSGAASDLFARVCALLSTLVGIPSISGHEEGIRAYLAERLSALGAVCQVDAVGNLIATLAGSGAPLLLNAHMDRVPPGLGHVPRIVGGRMYSDGATNLGADDTAGIAIILLAVEYVIRRGLPHPPLVLLFTVGEEVGLRGAAAFDPAQWQVDQGIVFDNAGAPGAVVIRASTYIAFDATIHGAGGHPGKDLDGTVSAIEIFRDVVLPLGRWEGDATRVSFGTIQGGTVRNAIPTEVRVAGEIRTLSEGSEQAALLASVERRFVDAATARGGSAEVAFESHGVGYAIPEDEPLFLAWREAWRAMSHEDASGIISFIGSDTNTLRQRARVFTVSTGVEDEHTVRESIALTPLCDLVLAAAHLLEAASHNARLSLPSEEPIR